MILYQSYDGEDDAGNKLDGVINFVMDKLAAVKECIDGLETADGRTDSDEGRQN